MYATNVPWTESGAVTINGNGDSAAYASAVSQTLRTAPPRAATASPVAYNASGYCTSPTSQPRQYRPTGLASNMYTAAAPRTTVMDHSTGAPEYYPATTAAQSTLPAHYVASREAAARGNGSCTSRPSTATHATSPTSRQTRHRSGKSRAHSKSFPGSVTTASSGVPRVIPAAQSSASYAETFELRQAVAAQLRAASPARSTAPSAPIPVVAQCAHLHPQPITPSASLSSQHPTGHVMVGSPSHAGQSIATSPLSHISSPSPISSPSLAAPIRGPLPTPPPVTATSPISRSASPQVRSNGTVSSPHKRRPMQRSNSGWSGSPNSYSGLGVSLDGVPRQAAGSPTPSPAARHSNARCPPPGFTSYVAIQPGFSVGAPQTAYHMSSHSYPSAIPKSGGQHGSPQYHDATLQHAEARRSHPGSNMSNQGAHSPTAAVSVPYSMQMVYGSPLPSSPLCQSHTAPALLMTASQALPIAAPVTASGNDVGAAPLYHTRTADSTSGSSMLSTSASTSGRDSDGSSPPIVKFAPSLSSAATVASQTPAVPLGLDPATATSLLLGMHRHMNPATLLSLLPYAYPAALAGLMELLRRNAAEAASDAANDANPTTNGVSANGSCDARLSAVASSSSAKEYARTLSHSPASSLAAALSTAILAASARQQSGTATTHTTLYAASSSGDEKSASTAPNGTSRDDKPNEAKLLRAVKKRLVCWTLPADKELKLTGDMLILYQALLPSADSVDRRKRFVVKLQRILDSEWPAFPSTAQLFGSTMSNLATSYSDIDICLMTEWPEMQDVLTLADGLRRHGMSKVSCIPGAKVPIVKLWDPELKLYCDINVNNPLSVQNTRMVRAYVAIDPRVRPLTMIIKHWTKRRELNDAAGGGTLSTYTWVNMIIFFLQTRNPPILPVLQQLGRTPDAGPGYFFEDVAQLTGYGYANHESLGALLYGFFKYYALEFNYENDVVCTRLGRCVLKKEKDWHVGRFQHMLCVEEPFTQCRNLGNSADEVSVTGMRDEFRRALTILHERADIAIMAKKYIFTVGGSLDAADKNASKQDKNKLSTQTNAAPSTTTADAPNADVSIGADRINFAVVAAAAAAAASNVAVTSRCSTMPGALHMMSPSVPVINSVNRSVAMRPSIVHRTPSESAVTAAPSGASSGTLRMNDGTDRSLVMPPGFAITQQQHLQQQRTAMRPAFHQPPPGFSVTTGYATPAPAAVATSPMIHQTQPQTQSSPSMQHMLPMVAASPQAAHSPMLVLHNGVSNQWTAWPAEVPLPTTTFVQSMPVHMQPLEQQRGGEHPSGQDWSAWRQPAIDPTQFPHLSRPVPAPSAASRAHRSLQQANGTAVELAGIRQPTVNHQAGLHMPVAESNGVTNCWTHPPVSSSAQRPDYPSGTEHRTVTAEVSGDATALRPSFQSGKHRNTTPRGRKAKRRTQQQQQQQQNQLQQHIDLHPTDIMTGKESHLGGQGLVPFTTPVQLATTATSFSHQQHHMATGLYEHGLQPGAAAAAAAAVRRSTQTRSDGDIYAQDSSYLTRPSPAAWIKDNGNTGVTYAQADHEQCDSDGTLTSDRSSSLPRDGMRSVGSPSKHSVDLYHPVARPGIAAITPAIESTLPTACCTPVADTKRVSPAVDAASCSSESSIPEQGAARHTAHTSGTGQQHHHRRSKHKHRRRQQQQQQQQQVVSQPHATLAPNVAGVDGGPSQPIRTGRSGRRRTISSTAAHANGTC